jgi:DNA polymerase-3 subunit chi
MERWCRLISPAMSDGADPEAVAAARECWSKAKAQAFEVTYWQADEQGRWKRVG